MAFSKLAIVSGEWQFDSDQTIRLYVRPTLTLINRAGETHHVPAFGYTTGRASSPFRSAPCIVLSGSGYSSCPTGGEHRETGSASNQKWLESLTQQTVHNLGELSFDCSPVMAFLVVKSNVLINVVDMADDVVCIDDTYSVNQYDETIIAMLKRLRLHDGR